MAEKGVGRGILRTLKSRQQAAATGPGGAQEPSAPESAPPPPPPGPSASALTEPLTPTTPLTPSSAEPPLSGTLPRRSMGRGFVASLVKRSGSSNPPPERDSEALKPITPAELATYKRVSPLQDAPAAAPAPAAPAEPVQRAPAQLSVPVVVPQRISPPAAESSRPAPRGRGLLIRGVRKSVSEDVESPTQPSPPEISSSRVAPSAMAPAPLPTKAPSAFSAPAPQVEQLTSRLAQTHLVDEGATTSREAEARSTGSAGSSKKSSRIASDDSKSQSQPATTTLTSLTSKSLEKAEAEIEVEQIMRQSPVKKMGTSGEPAKFMVNHVRLACKNEGVYQYVVQYDPQLDSQFQRIRLLNELREHVGPVKLFDGHTLFLPILLKDKVTTLQAKRRGDNQETTVRIQLTKILPPEKIPEPVFNFIFKKIMKELEYVRIGQHYFSKENHVQVPQHGLEIWPGYTTAVHEQQDGLFLTIDVAHKVLRSQTCYALMMDLAHVHDGYSPQFRQEVFNALVGNIVLTRYNNKTYKIDDIVWDSNPESKFNYRMGEITYVDYYKTQYQIDIRDRKQPLLVHRPKKKKQPSPTSQGADAGQEVICLIPELCFLTGLNEQIRNDTNLKRDLATFARLSPTQRIESLRKLIGDIKAKPEAYRSLTDWGLELDDDLFKLDGRVVPREKIFFARREIEVDAKADWTKACGTEQVLKAVEIMNWICVYPQNRERQVENFVMTAIEAAQRIGIRLAMPMVVPLRDDRPETYYNYIKENLNQYTQIVFIAFSMLSDNRYSRVKRLCCIENPVPSQVALIKTLSKPDNVLRTVAQKIVLQMNVKLGGELWRVSIPFNKLMIVGIDIYHQTEKKYKSIAGFVSSLNETQTRWYSKVCFQMVGQELVDTLKTAFVQAIKKYQEVNNFLPDRIIIFRDGVSEGQIPHVTNHEIPQLRTCFSDDYNPELSFVIVQKRIGTRVFAKPGVNAPPGSVVDHSITSVRNYDFYLVSQLVNQGTVTPTHFIVAYDSSQIKPDHIQRISYKMTHMYYNWTGTIRVPAPCQYAHKLAFLTGQYLQDEPDEALCNRLFYL